MPYLFTCPHCSAKTQVEDRYSGQSGECFACGAKIDIPDFAGTGETATSRPGRRPLGSIVAASIVLVLLASLVFAVIQFGGASVARLASVRIQRSSINKLESIAKAMNAYAADYGTYPPAVLTNAGGVPMHSWRVLLLPYLGEKDHFAMFDLSKPWNHPVNLEAAYTMPDVYLHPADDSAVLDRSGYYLITGTGTLFPARGPMSPDQITDKPGQTILVVAGAPPTNRSIGGWTEPYDYDFSKMQGIVNGARGTEPGGFVDEGVTIVTADGRGHFLPNSLTPATFNALVTPRGNEPLADDTLD
ncbi:DUF1559 domain-containing protein [Stieleria sp. JC731]|uniref:DUF1559 family PulG-like putative transporter n=1 Tax=Pirellulaceae TaxID=2691357 RepID=UPI001E6121E4|nr:DUF1559 domain-containing protein [Stieleria sp. JC731]MCC9599744.1 DUF1559 domain-containing protein [Stieleria sp. JC731]